MSHIWSVTQTIGGVILSYYCPSEKLSVRHLIIKDGQPTNRPESIPLDIWNDALDSAKHIA